MKQLMLVIAISILSVAALACGPAVGRAVGDAQVDVDATLAEMGEPTTEAEKELYAMMKEIDRLHKEEREDLLGALDDSGNIINNLVGVIDSLGNELDEETLIKIGSVIASGQDVDAFFQGVREQAYQNSAREDEINKLLQNEERATWDRIKFLNEQLDKANAEKAGIKKDLDKAHVNLDKADKDENKWIKSNLDKEQEKQILEVRMERAAGKFEVVTAMIDQVLGDEDDDAADAPSAFEKSAEEAGRYQAAGIFHDCLVDWGVEVKETTREEMKHCRQGVIDELDSLGTKTVKIENGEVISEPNYVALLDLDDVKEVVDTFMHCAQSADAVRIIGPAVEGCKMEAKEMHHDAAGHGSSFTDHFANKIAGDNADARRTRKFIDVKAEAIGDPDFQDKVNKVMYQPGRSKDEVRDSFKSLLNEAKEDLHCDPQGLRAKRCDDIKFPDENQRPRLDEGRNVPVAHQYENRIKDTNRRGGGGQNQGGGGQNQGLPPGITKAQFNEVFGGGEPRMVVKERVDQCVADGNPMNECLRDVKNDMREEFKSHENFDQKEYSDRKEFAAENVRATRQNIEKELEGVGRQGQPGLAGGDQNHFAGFGDGAAKRGHHQMMECMNTAAGATGSTGAAGVPAFGDAADTCMTAASDMMQGSFGNRDMGNHSGMVGTHGSTGTQGFAGMQGTTGGSQQ